MKPQLKQLELKFLKEDDLPKERSGLCETNEAEFTEAKRKYLQYVISDYMIS
jgi:hypothetical protein